MAVSDGKSNYIGLPQIYKMARRNAEQFDPKRGRLERTSRVLFGRGQPDAMIIRHGIRYMLLADTRDPHLYHYVEE